MIKQYAEQFWAKVEKGMSCWVWQGARKSEAGLDYGQFYYKGKRLASHRVAWELTNGIIPKGLCVLHKCDIPSCVNPDHLFLGTRKDNIADRHIKGRDSHGLRHSIACSGENHGSAKLNDNIVKQIRYLCKQGNMTHAQIAAKFGVHKSQISKVKLRTTWKYGD